MPVPQVGEQLVNFFRFLDVQSSVEQVIDVPKIPEDSIQQRLVDRDSRVPQRAEQLVEVPTVLTLAVLAEQIVDIPVPRGRGCLGGGRGGGLQGFLQGQYSRTSRCVLTNVASSACRSSHGEVCTVDASTAWIARVHALEAGHYFHQPLVSDRHLALFQHCMMSFFPFFPRGGGVSAQALARVNYSQ